MQTIECEKIKILNKLTEEIRNIRHKKGEGEY